MTRRGRRETTFPEVTRPANSTATKNPHNRTLPNIPRGERGEQSAPLGRANTSARPTGVCTGHRPAAAGTLAAEPTPWLDCDSAGQRDGRRPRPAAGRGARPTECALTHYPLAGEVLCGFAIRQNGGRSIRPAQNRQSKSVAVIPPTAPGRAGSLRLGKGRRPAPRCIPPCPSYQLLIAWL